MWMVNNLQTSHWSRTGLSKYPHEISKALYTTAAGKQYILKIHQVTITYPVNSTEVNSFSKIKTLVKTTMVGSWKCNHKLSSTLVSSVNLRRQKFKVFSDIIKDNLVMDYVEKIASNN